MHYRYTILSCLRSDNVFKLHIMFLSCSVCVRMCGYVYLIMLMHPGMSVWCVWRVGTSKQAKRGRHTLLTDILCDVLMDFTASCFFDSICRSSSQTFSLPNFLLAMLYAVSPSYGEFECLNSSYRGLKVVVSVPYLLGKGLLHKLTRWQSLHHARSQQQRTKHSYQKSMRENSYLFC